MSLVQTVLIFDQAVFAGQFLSGDFGALTRHGEAVVSLLNDRWRTRAALTSDAHGMVEVRATLGSYVASWEQDGAPVHVEFVMERGPGVARIAAVSQPAAFILPPPR